jgi:WD40 repeat protein
MRRRHFWLAGVALALVSPVAAQQPAPAPPPVAPNQARLDQTITGLDGPAFAVVYNEEAGILAAACEEQTVQCWPKDVALGVRAVERTPYVLRGHPGPVTALAWAGGAVLASAGADPHIFLWEMPGGRLRQTLTAASRVRALAMAPDGKVLAAGGEDGAVQLWDVAAGKPGARLAGHADWVLALAFSPDGQRLASGGYDGVRLWDVAAGKKLLDVPAAPPAPANAPPPAANVVLALAFSPDGKTLAVGGSDARVHLVGAADGKVVRSLAGHTSSVTALAFHPGGVVLASASKDRTVRLWNPADGQLLKALEGHTAWVEGVTFLARGTRLASAGADRTVRLWDLTPLPQK